MQLEVHDGSLGARDMVTRYRPRATARTHRSAADNNVRVAISDDVRTVCCRPRAGGDETAFAGLLKPYERELHAHCYRMLGSVYDADDALQDAELRAWKALKRFEGRSSCARWLYTIATNTCLTQIQRRPKRVLPIDYGPATDPLTGPGPADHRDGLDRAVPGHRARGRARRPRGALRAARERRAGLHRRAPAPAGHAARGADPREVLGFSAKEVAETLDTTVASVNSALQRARASIEERVGDQTQQQTLRTLGDDEIEEIVKSYVDAWERNDVEAVVSLLTEDAAISMPPLASWFGPRDQFESSCAEHPDDRADPLEDG